jgi:translation elongation factor EF-G
LVSIPSQADQYQGKTTTTERMLYYSGYTRRIGGRLPLFLFPTHSSYARERLLTSYDPWHFNSRE